MFEQLKLQTLKANILLPKYNLVTFTWGNVSQIDRKAGVVAIKPSGVRYEDMTKDDIVVVDLQSGKVIDGKLKPSSDTATHLEIYKSFDTIGGIVHTHSRWATVMAQSGLSIPPLGTTHADYFYGEIPCTPLLSEEEIESEYERNTGKIIARCFFDKEPLSIPAALVQGHGPFAWGVDCMDAVHNAVVLEEIAFMAWHNILLNKDIKPVGKYLLDKHYLRKHGKNAYYGQDK